MAKGKHYWLKVLWVGFILGLFLLPMTAPNLGAAEKELTIMVWSHFIPDVDKELKAHAEEFAKKKGVKVRIDTIDLKQFVVKKAAEAQSKSGHDIIQN
jgi:spermidine/putrescine-binding protein